MATRSPVHLRVGIRVNGLEFVLIRPLVRVEIFAAENYEQAKQLENGQNTTSLAPICKIKTVPNSTIRAEHLREIINYVAHISIVHMPFRIWCFKNNN